MTKENAPRTDVEEEIGLQRAELATQEEALRHTNLELAATRAHLAALLDAVPAGIASLGPKDVVLEVNATLACMLGVARESMVGVPFEMLVPPGDRPHMRSFLEGLGAESGVRWCDVVLTRADRSNLRAHVQGVTIPPVSAARAQVLLAITDMTERAQLDDARRSIDQRLADASRAESLVRMAGGVAHDFNNLPSPRPPTGKRPSSSSPSRPPSPRSSSISRCRGSAVPPSSAVSAPSTPTCPSSS